MLPYLAAEGPSRDSPKQQLGTPTLGSSRGKPTEATSCPSRPPWPLVTRFLWSAHWSQKLTSAMPFILDTQKVDRSQVQASRGYSVRLCLKRKQAWSTCVGEKARPALFSFKWDFTIQLPDLTYLSLISSLICLCMNIYSLDIFMHSYSLYIFIHICYIPYNIFIYINYILRNNILLLLFVVVNIMLNYGPRFPGHQTPSDKNN